MSVSVVALAACGGGSSGGSTGDFCNGLKGYTALFAGSGANSANESQFLAALSDLTNKAPSEIKSDMAAITAAVKAEQSFASLASADPSKSDSLESQFSSQSASLATASANIEKFAKDKCGIDLNSTASSSSSSTSSESAASGDFCQQIASVGSVNIADDPSGAKAAVATFKKLNPPSEIASQWDDYLAALDEIAATDPSDQSKLASITQAHIQSFAAIGQYITQTCASALGSLSSFSS
jgi:hypothetical protein